MCKAFHGRSGLHPMMLPQGLKCLARQMIVANGGVILRISGSLSWPHESDHAVTKLRDGGGCGALFVDYGFGVKIVVALDE
jgi:hypothetical protein